MGTGKRREPPEHVRRAWARQAEAGDQWWQADTPPEQRLAQRVLIETLAVGVDRPAGAICEVMHAGQPVGIVEGHVVRWYPEPPEALDLPDASDASDDAA